MSNQTPAERARKIAEACSEECPDHSVNVNVTKLIARLTAALTIPANHIRTPEGKDVPDTLDEWSNRHPPHDVEKFYPPSTPTPQPAEPKVMPWPEDLTTLENCRITATVPATGQTRTDFCLGLFTPATEYNYSCIRMSDPNDEAWDTKYRKLVKVEELREVHPPQPSEQAKGAEWLPLSQIREGAVFETKSGVLAVKSEYHLSHAGDIQCILVESGEYAHFCQDKDIIDSLTRAQRHNSTLCREIDIESERAQHKAEMEAVKKELQSQDETTSWVAAVLTELDRGGGLGMCTHKKLKECVDLLRKREKELESAKGASR